MLLENELFTQQCIIISLAITVLELVANIQCNRNSDFYSLYKYYKGRGHSYNIIERVLIEKKESRIVFHIMY